MIRSNDFRTIHRHCSKDRVCTSIRRLIMILPVFLMALVLCRPAEARASSNIIQTDASRTHNAILLDDGSLWMWGFNNHGELGGAYQTDGLQDARKCFSDVKYVSLGDGFTAMIKFDDSLWMCGENDFGQLGDGTTTDRIAPVKIMDDVVDVSAGTDHTAIVKKDGTVWMCGKNDHGQFGNNTKIDSLVPIWVDLQKATGVDVKITSVSAGGWHTAFITENGNLYTCGRNDEGQLGIGSLQTWYRPQHVRIIRDFTEQTYKKIISVEAGYTHTVIITDDDDMYMCGYGGAYSEKSVPEKYLRNVKKASVASGYSAFLQKDGTLWMMGENNRGQLGNGTKHQSTAPFQLRSNVADVAVGGEHTIIFDKDNTFWGCGDNSGYCLIGNGNGKEEYRLPVQLNINLEPDSYGKIANTMTVSGKTVKASSKNKTTIKRSKAFMIKDAVGAVTFKKVSGNKKISINTKSGNITVKRGLKKGKTYRLKVRISVAGSEEFEALSKTVTVRIKIS